MDAETPTIDDERWAIMQRRDPEDRPRFVMAVTTTGIYCRPGCPARMPLRKNVVFFEAPDEAKAAGFRACKRCKPDAPA